MRSLRSWFCKRPFRISLAGNEPRYGASSLQRGGPCTFRWLLVFFFLRCFACGTRRCGTPYRTPGSKPGLEARPWTAHGPLARHTRASAVSCSSSMTSILPSRSVLPQPTRLLQCHVCPQFEECLKPLDVGVAVPSSALIFWESGTCTLYFFNHGLHGTRQRTVSLEALKSVTMLSLYGSKTWQCEAHNLPGATPHGSANASSVQLSKIPVDSGGGLALVASGICLISVTFLTHTTVKFAPDALPLGGSLREVLKKVLVGIPSLSSSQPWQARPVWEMRNLPGLSALQLGTMLLLNRRLSPSGSHQAITGGVHQTGNCCELASP